MQISTRPENPSAGAPEGAPPYRPIWFVAASTPLHADAFAILVVVAAAAFRASLLPELGDRLPFVAFYPAVMLAALYGGLRGGLLATALSVALAKYFWIAPHGSPGVDSPGDMVRIATFGVSGLLASWLVGSLHRALAETRRAKAELQAQQAQLSALVAARTAALEAEVAERKRAEATLTEAQRIANIGSWEWDARTDGSIWSAQMYAIFDVEPGAFEPRVESVVELIAAEDRERVKAALYGAVAHATRCAAEFEVPTRHGTRLVLMQAEPVPGPEGRVERLLGTAADITARKKTELALLAATAEAERANNAKSRFLAAASHDLRQPLSALTIYVDVLKRKVAPEDRAILDNMKDCVGSLSELLSDLLDLSKLDAGVVTPNVSEFPVDELLRGLVSVHAPEALLKELRPRCVSSRLIGRTDQVLLRRMLGNLLSNAICYTERGGVLIGCRRRQGTVWVEVWDSGIGIPADKTDEIFEEFKQLGDEARSARNRNRGSGLGLAIVAKTAALLGLRLRVRSWPGRGSLFAVELPLGEKPTPPLRREAGTQALRIAVVEDNAVVREALVQALEAASHEVIAAGDGEELLSRLDGASPDIVISDYRLAAGETGFDVIKQLRGVVGDALPAILVTGDTDPGLLRSMANRGIVVLHKPLDVDALLACIGKSMQRTPREEAARA